MARKKTLVAAPVASAPEEEQIPHYETSRSEQYLNYILGSSETFPQNPSSRLEEYLYYLCKYGSNIGLKAKKVDVLPDVGKGNILYLVPKQDGEDPNVCEEYLWIDDKFELIGSTSIDLSQYQKKLTALEGISLDDTTSEIGVDFNKVCSIVKLNEELGYKAGKFIVESEGTIQTSTLPAIAVPALTEEQLSQLLTAFSQEKVCYIKSGDEVLNVNQSDSENSEIKVWYHGYYLTYALNGSSVVVEYLQMGGGKMYCHYIRFMNSKSSMDIRNKVSITLTIITSRSTQFNSFYDFQQYAFIKYNMNSGMAPYSGIPASVIDSRSGTELWSCCGLLKFPQSSSQNIYLYVGDNREVNNCFIKLPEARDFEFVGYQVNEL